MSEAHKKIDVDAALAAWPAAPEPGGSDARVRSILARLDAAPDDDDDDDDALLSAPFADDPDERQRDRESFRAIARLAPSLTPAAPVVLADPATDEPLDSGIVDLAAAAAADPGAEARARTRPLAKDDLFEETPRSRHPISMGPMPSSVPSIPIVALSSRRLVDDVGAGPASTRSPAEPAKRGVPLYLAGGVAMFAAAAAFFLLMKAPPPATPTANVTTTQVPSAPITSEPAVPAPPEPAATVASVEPSAGAPGIPPAASPPAITARQRAKVPPVETRAATPEAAQSPEETVSPLQVPAAGTVGAAGTGSVPQRPSQGAIAGAFRPVLNEARACLGAEDAPVRASVVFAADGSVQSVALAPSGAADPCIKAALVKARVSPFAEPTFAATANIRPN